MDNVKRIHIKTKNGAKETVMFSEKATVEEVHGVLVTLLDLPMEYNGQLKLTKADGAAVKISPEIPVNSANEPYALEVAVEDNSQLKASVTQLKQQLAELEKTFQTALAAFNASSKKVKHFSEEANKYTFTQETRDNLKNPSFDSWLWEENEMSSLLELMFVELGLIEEFKISIPTLRRFIKAAKDNYNDNPFHNFRHCFCVTQMMYGMLHTTGLVQKLKPMDKLILVVSCIGHDLDHPGINNAYQINAKTDLATIYSDMSPLENHHAAILFSILKNPQTNILGQVSEAIFKDARKGIIKCILATDMAKHGEILNQFKKIVDTFNYDDAEHKSLLLQMVTKCADISNEVRPATVAEPWVDCLLEEFFSQSDREKAEGLPVAPFMDRDKVTKPGAQIGFIGFVMIPLFELVSKVLPQMDEVIISPIKKSLAYYKEMGEKHTPVLKA